MVKTALARTPGGLRPLSGSPGAPAHVALVPLLRLLLLALTLPAASHTQAALLPHVDDCGMCMSCVVDAAPPPGGRPLTHADIIPANFEPQNVHEKQVKPLCQECRGCTTSLQALVRSGGKQLWNRTFRDEGGASSNWLFVAPTDRTPSGKAIVKVACIPVGKHAASRHPKCFPELTTNFVKILLAIEKIAEDCDLTDVVPKVWVEPISAIIPEIGYHIRWFGLWMEQAEGVSLENLVRLGTPMMHPNEFLQIMHDVVNHTQVIHAAIFDLLTSQCDRHAQNIFIGEKGGIKVIDNERAFFENGFCGIDSILLPTTKKFTINVMENAWVNKFKNWGTKQPKCWANPPLLLDYRCHVKGGKLGKQWPPGVDRCLKRLSTMTTEQILDDYNFPSLVTAQALKNRSLAMYEDGFEAALTHSYPLNPTPWRYKFVQPCCEIIHTDTYRCKHPWAPDTAIPLGDVIGGGPWKHERPDPGTYVGGSVF